MEIRLRRKSLKAHGGKKEIMPSLLERFQTSAIGSRGRIADYIPVVSSVGDFARVNDIEVILSSWNNILLTPLRTYLYNPNYGSDLYKYAFEPADETTSSGIKTEIRNRISKYDSRATITALNIRYMHDGHGFIVDITMEYEGKEGTLSVQIDGNKYLNIL